MAKGYQFITGNLGPLVICHIKATNRIILRSRSSAYKQTAGAIGAQSTFGMASVTGKILRQKLSSILPFPKDRMMQLRFCGAIHRWLKANPVAGLQVSDERIGLSNFAFNKACNFGDRWKAAIEIKKNAQGILVLKIAGFNPLEKISAPAGTVAVECRIAAAGCLLKKGLAAGQFETTFTIPYNNQQLPAREVDLGILANPGSLVICAAHLSFHITGKGGKAVTKNLSFIPAGVVGAIWGGGVL